MTIPIIRTEAEEQLAAEWQRVKGDMPGDAAMADARAQAMRLFRATGLPHRRVEAWKYTDLRVGLKTAFPPARCATTELDQAALTAALSPDLAALDCIRIVLLNGRIVSRHVPAGENAASIGSLAGALADPVALRGSFAIPAEEPDEAVLALNTAFVTDGVTIRVGRGEARSRPIHIVSIVTGDTASALATRNVIHLEAGAAAIVVESHVELGSAARQATAVTEARLGEGATLHHIQHVARGTGSLHLARTEVTIAEGANYRGFQLTAGAGLARNETRVGFTGPDARVDVSGLMLGRGRDHIDTTLIVNHTSTGCESRELFKAVLDDAARAVFQGKVIVAPEAQKTDGKQMAQALMLSEAAEFDSKPELEIYADDVVCGHGSTAAELDADMLFYLRSRGIPLTEARAMLIESFATEALERIEPEPVRQAMRAIVLSWLRGGT